jgi:hypothetical protein
MTARIMKKKVSPYARGIWTIDRRYRIAHSSLSKSQVETIFRLASVEAAKKQIPPIAPGDLLPIAELVCALPRAAVARSEDIEGYLRQGNQCRGAGFATLICMLAVESRGDYPPIDRKFAAGLRARNKISDRELDALTGKAYSAFADTYVRKVIPAWHQSRRTRSAEEADCYWGRAAGKKRRR